MFDAGKDLRLDGKVALVTGGTRGIGRGIAEAYAAAGAAVCVTARKPDELEETLNALREAGGTASTYQASAGDPEAVEASVAHCVDALGACDILVNNAATNPYFGPLIEADLGAVRKTWQVNQEGPLLYCQAAWRRWMREHGGVIVNITSLGGLRASPLLGAYNMTKAALVQLTRQLALELAPGVRVNAIAPAVVKTYFARALYEADEQAAVSRHPLGRLGVPDDVAGIAVFLASDAASWMTGETVVVDGGAALL